MPTYEVEMVFEVEADDAEEAVQIAEESNPACYVTTVVVRGSDE